MPAVSFPTGLNVDKAVDTLSPDYEAWSDTCQAINEEYDKDLIDGMPISLQLVGRKLEEEKLLSMTETVLQAVSRS